MCGVRGAELPGQVQVLSDHIEKLMMFLKHEATQKAKAHEGQRRLQKELELVKVSRPHTVESFNTSHSHTTYVAAGMKNTRSRVRTFSLSLHQT